MKYILSLILFSLVLTMSPGYSQIEKYDKKILKVLYKEMKAAQKVLKFNKSSKNFYRLFNSRIEILKFKTKNIQELRYQKKSKAEIKKAEDNAEKFYRDTKKIGDYIHKRFKKFNNMGKFYLMFGLMIYEFEGESSQVAHYLTKAVGLLSDEELKNLAAVKLGDYYFNTKQFDKAIKAYRYAFKLKNNSTWRDRILYNLAWSYFKVDEFPNAVKFMYAIYKTSPDRSQKNYYYTQSINKIPEFLVFAGQPDKGMEFVFKTKKDDGKALFAYIQHVYSKGFFRKFDSYVTKVESRLMKRNKIKTLVSFQVEVFNFLALSEFKKNFETLIALRANISKYFQKGTIDETQKKDFLANNRALLTQNFDRINTKNFSKKDKYYIPVIKDSIDILKTLILLDPNGQRSYKLRIAQLYRKLENYPDALETFEELYNSAPKKTNPEAQRSLVEILAIYIPANFTNYDREKAIKYYTEYIRYGKDAKIVNNSYLKLYDEFFDKKNYPKAFSLTKSYYKRFPAEIKQVELMLLKLAAVAQAEKKTKLFAGIRKYVNSDPQLSKSKELKRGLSETYQNLMLAKVNKLLQENKGDKAQIAGKLKSFYYSKSIDRVNKLISGFNAGLLYSQIGNTQEAGSILGSLVSNSQQSEFNGYGPKILVIADNSSLTEDDYSMGLYMSLLKKSCELKDFGKERIFLKALEHSLAYGKFNETTKILGYVKSCKLEANTLNKAFNLLGEYFDWNKSEQVVQALRLMAQNVLNTWEDTEAFIQDYISYRINEVESLRVADFKIMISSVGTILGQARLPRKSTVYLQSSKLIEYAANPINFKEMKVNENNLTQFLDFNFSQLAGKLAFFSKYKSKYPLVKYLVTMGQLSVFDEFFKFFARFNSFVENPQKVSEFEGLLAQAMQPFVEKQKQLKNDLKFFRDSSGFSLRYEAFGVPLDVVYVNKRFIPWDK
ncbi:MAG: tetratricopeptide repeat protein [Halobacteriovoraceae bacterium]|nr:tetratricopeptide repeat protein [Halobacteriovoraceae bacterium]MCB9095773.1 tetratricopeptide repeat protein [Halobacteriovoraceae bacterium]